MVHVQYIKLPLSSSNFSRDTQLLRPNMKNTALQVSAAFGHAHFASYTQCTILRTLAISACHRLFIYTITAHHQSLESASITITACHRWTLRYRHVHHHDVPTCGFHVCTYTETNIHKYIDTIQKQDLELVRPHMGFVWLSRTLQTSPVCISAKHMPH